MDIVIQLGINKISILGLQRKWPEEGWGTAAIELLLQEIALMDSNNFPGNYEL